MFTVGTGGLVAACDFCTAVVPATRDEQLQCVLPAGWQRIGPPHPVDTEHTVPLPRSALMCPACQERVAAGELALQSNSLDEVDLPDDDGMVLRSIDSLDIPPDGRGLARFTLLVEVVWEDYERPAPDTELDGVCGQRFRDATTIWCRMNPNHKCPHYALGDITTQLPGLGHLLQQFFLPPSKGAVRRVDTHRHA